MKKFALHFALQPGRGQDDLKAVLPTETTFAEGDSFLEWGGACEDGEPQHGMVYFDDRSRATALWVLLTASGTAGQGATCDPYGSLINHTVTTAEDWSILA